MAVNVLTLKMHYGIPNVFNFCIVTLYRCRFHQFHYMDRTDETYIYTVS